MTWFELPKAEDGVFVTPSHLVDRVIEITIMSKAEFREFWAQAAPAGWQP